MGIAISKKAYSDRQFFFARGRNPAGILFWLFIQPDYMLAGIYHDNGISGFKENRPGFQKMMDDARAGKIDLIYTKSITRFARNTDTILKATRELKELGIGVFFELLNINTLTRAGSSL